MIRVSERSVDGAEGGAIKVIPMVDGRVSIKWGCGGSRTFTADALEVIVAHIDAYGVQEHGRLRFGDAAGTSFYVWRIGDELAAADSPASPHEATATWPDLAKCIARTIRQVRKEAEDK